MVKKLDRNKLRQKKHRSIRKKIVGTAERPRLAVYRSLQNIFVQVIDDTTGNTLVSASTIEKGAKIENGSNIEAAKQVGERIAKKALLLLYSTEEDTFTQEELKLLQMLREKQD